MPTAYAAPRGYRPAVDTPRFFLYFGAAMALPYAALLRRYGKAIRGAEPLRDKKNAANTRRFPFIVKLHRLHKMQRRIFHVIIVVVIVVIRLVNPIESVRFIDGIVTKLWHDIKD